MSQAWLALPVPYIAKGPTVLQSYMSCSLNAFGVCLGQRRDETYGLLVLADSRSIICPPVVKEPSLGGFD